MGWMIGGVIYSVGNVSKKQLRKYIENQEVIFMKFMLENPSFTNGPVEIDNKQAVKQITAYINKPIILGDEILIVVDGLPFKLQWIDIKDDEYKFKNVRLKR